MKYRSFVLTVLTSLFMLAGCGESGALSKAGDSPADTSPAEASSEAADESSTAEAISMTELSAAVTGADSGRLTGAACIGQELFDSNTKRLYRCELTELADGFIAYNEEGRIADEVSVIRRADGDTTAAEKALTDRRSVRYEDFKGYVPEELPKIENGRVFSAGGYSVLIISDKADELESLLREKLA